MTDNYKENKNCYCNKNVLIVGTHSALKESITKRLEGVCDSIYSSEGYIDGIYQLLNRSIHSDHYSAIIITNQLNEMDRYTFVRKASLITPDTHFILLANHKDVSEILQERVLYSHLIKMKRSNEDTAFTLSEKIEELFNSEKEPMSASALIYTAEEILRYEAPWLLEHMSIVRRQAIRFAQQIEDIPPENIHNLIGAIGIHDYGKAAFPTYLFRKTDPLTEKEKKIIHMQPLIIYNIINRIPDNEQTANIALQHHERPDGKGYPFGISSILPEARALAIIETYYGEFCDKPYNIKDRNITPAIALKNLRRYAQQGKLDNFYVDLFSKTIEDDDRH
jgi:HD-GYP domain-containing protein (c-di-GMP phosphodiesterase class II)